MAVLPLHPPTQSHAYHPVVHDLITMGTDLARLIHARATAGAEAASSALPPVPHPDPDALIALAAAFDRAARAVRRAILLAQRLDKPVADPAGQRASARKRIIREVEDAITRETDRVEAAGTDAAALATELRDRLDGPDMDDDLASRPVPEIITEICRDLGLATPAGADPWWKRRTPQDIQDLCARAAAAPKAPPAATPGPDEAVAAVLRQPTILHPRWRAPPG